MKHYIVKLETGTCGTESYELISIEEGTTEKEINDMIHEMACSNAEMYGIYERPFDFSAFEDEDGEDNYSEDICGFIIGEYDPELHDMYRSGGGSFKEDIQ